MKAKNIDLSISDEALSYLAKIGFDPVYGARPLKRVIQNQIQNVLAKKIIANEVQSGERVAIDLKDGKLEFKH